MNNHKKVEEQDSDGASAEVLSVVLELCSTDQHTLEAPQVSKFPLKRLQVSYPHISEGANTLPKSGGSEAPPLENWYWVL